MGVFFVCIVVVECGLCDGSFVVVYVVVVMLVLLVEVVVVDCFVVDLGLVSLVLWCDWLFKLCMLVFFQEVGMLVVWYVVDCGEVLLFVNYVCNVVLFECVVVDLCVVDVFGIVQFELLFV